MMRLRISLLKRKCSSLSDRVCLYVASLCQLETDVLCLALKGFVDADKVLTSVSIRSLSFQVLFANDWSLFSFQLNAHSNMWNNRSTISSWWRLTLGQSVPFTQHLGLLKAHFYWQLERWITRITNLLFKLTHLVMCTCRALLGWRAYWGNAERACSVPNQAVGFEKPAYLLCQGMVSSFYLPPSHSYG